MAACRDRPRAVTVAVLPHPLHHPADHGWTLDAPWSPPPPPHTGFASKENEYASEYASKDYASKEYGEPRSRLPRSRLHWAQENPDPDPGQENPDPDPDFLGPILHPSTQAAGG